MACPTFCPHPHKSFANLQTHDTHKVNSDLILENATFQFIEVGHITDIFSVVCREIPTKSES